MRPGQLFSELQRRRVLRVIGAYAVAAWVAVEVYTTVQPILLPDYERTTTYVVILAILGFPLVFALAWIFDITPQGVRRTAALTESGEVPPEPFAPPPRRYLSPRATGFFGLGILVAMVAVAAYAGVDRAQPRAPERAIRSIAVLPFVDMSSARDQEFFSDGISEELLNRLAQVPDLDVPARTSSFAFKGRNEDVREIGRRLNVQGVLEGSVRREGERVRVTAQLIDVATGYHIWSENFEGDATDVFALQDRIADGIVGALRVRIAAAPEAGERGTKNVRAHELYLLGQQRWHQRTDRDLRQALTYFQGAVAEDSLFALAYAALARTFAVLPAYGDFPVDSAMLKGSAAAARAIDLDPSLAEAYAAMGQLVQNFEWDLLSAQRYYVRALAYRPNDATTMQWHAEALMLLGQYDSAQAQIGRVLASTALSPVALNVEAYLKNLRGESDEALAAWRELARLHPRFELGLLNQAYAAAAAGRTDQAAAAVRRLAESTPARAGLYGAMAAALQDPGARPRARAALDTAPLSASERTAWLIILGDHAAALRVLDAGYQQRADANLLFLLPHPLLKPLRADPLFQRMVGEVGISYTS